MDKPAREFPLTSLAILSGEIPEGLQGTLYRNGPARLVRGDWRVGHWFDGDGAILAVHFRERKHRQFTATFKQRAIKKKRQQGNFSTAIMV